MDNINKYKEYCCGCGLCISTRNVKYHKNNGFLVPELQEANAEFCKKICPSNGEHIRRLNPNKPWGNYIDVLCTWSDDEIIRNKASSGGTITSILEYLLDNKIVDKIIQTIPDSNCQIHTKTITSIDKNDILKCMGSRYTTSSPLINILEQTSCDCKYAFVGKPCDIIALKNYMEINKTLKEKIVVTISFFCAGMPSESANNKLLEKLKTSKDECKSLIYRGNGWPGFATAVDNNGNSNRITYNESWGKILGRDVNKYCRFCMDGVGAFADIACGDAWYIKNNEPDFNEHDGRNVTFTRTKIGHNIVMSAIESNYLKSEDYDISDLSVIQKFQYARRQHVLPRLYGMIICGKTTPNYNITNLRPFSRNLSLSKKLKATGGTIKRVLQGKL